MQRHDSYINSCWQHCMFPYKIQDTSRTIGQTLIVIVVPWQSFQSVTIAIKTEKMKAKTVTVKKQKKRRMMSPLPSSSGSFLSCMYTACTQLSVTRVLLFSLSLPLALAFSPPSLARSLTLPFRLKPEGKSLLLNSDAAVLTNPLNEEVGSSQWESRRWTQPYETEKERRKALGNDVGGGKRSSQKETRQRRQHTPRRTQTGTHASNCFTATLLRQITKC